MKQDRKYMLIAVVSALGVLTGFGAYSYLDQGPSYCEGVENDVKQNQKFNGSIACYEPGVIEVNLSEEVEEGSELKCVCRIIDDDAVRIFPLAVSN